MAATDVGRRVPVAARAAGAGAPPREAAPVADAPESVQRGLAGVAAELTAAGMPAFGEAGRAGQRIRPLLAYAGALADGAAPSAAGAEPAAADSAATRRFWRAVGAVQLAHEASLVHDDIVDDAAERRGTASRASQHGIGAALVYGDHLLTAAYRLAAATASQPFQAAFARAVERTVAGEAEQGRCRGERLSAEAYRAIVLGKSGELLGCALATSALLADSPRSEARYELGRRLGLAYQMLDDLLDYCPAAETGKPPLRDHARGHWTWVLEEWSGARFGLSTDALHAELHAPRPGGSVMAAALDRYEALCARLAADVAAELPGDGIVTSMLSAWALRARRAVAAESARHAAAEPAHPGAVPPTPGEAAEPARPAATPSARPTVAAPFALASPAALLAEPSDRDWSGSMARHGRSFHFAARWMPAAARARIERVYAYCRFTDDLADGEDARAEPALALARLDRWQALSAAAYAGHATGLPALDATMRESAGSGVPFECAAELIEGMRMDVRGTTYRTMEELRLYTFRVAGVVGVWLTRMFGVHDAPVLERAAQLGHAMQLTNILRDVGEDLDAGRVYIPAELLAAHGLDADALRAMAATGRIAPAWAGLVERLLRDAEQAYDEAFAAIPALPGFFQPAVAIAAHVYRGIHARIRAHGYDNLTRRAATGRVEKARLALAALRALMHARGRWPAVRSGYAVAPAAVPQAVASARLVRRAIVAGAIALCVAPGGVAAQTVCASPPRTAAYLEAAERRAAVQPLDAAALLDVVRGHYFVAVEDRASIDAGHRALDRLQHVALPRDEADAALRDAYRGALTALQARHGRWPPHRLRDVRTGLGVLDHAVARAPDVAEIRYLRLVTGFYLPSLFGRGDAVREDFTALAALLPAVPVAARPPAFAAIVRFVLEHGEPTDDERQRLRALASGASAGMHPDPVRQAEGDRGDGGRGCG